MLRTRSRQNQSAPVVFKGNYKTRLWYNPPTRKSGKARAKWKLDRTGVWKWRTGSNRTRHAHRTFSRRCPKLTSLTGGNFFLHSRDKARKSLCIFSSSFFTASGLLVPDMIHQTIIQYLSGANELQHCQLLGATGSSLPASLALPQPAAWAPRGSARPGLRTRSVPERPPQPSRNSRVSYPRRPPQSPRPARLRRLWPRSPQGGQVRPAAAGSGHTVRHQPTWQKASALAPQALQTRRRH